MGKNSITKRATCRSRPLHGDSFSLYDYEVVERFTWRFSSPPRGFFFSISSTFCKGWDVIVLVPSTGILFLYYPWNHFGYHWYSSSRPLHGDSFSLCDKEISNILRKYGSRPLHGDSFSLYDVRLQFSYKGCSSRPLHGDSFSLLCKETKETLDRSSRPLHGDSFSLLFNDHCARRKKRERVLVPSTGILFLYTET